MPYYDVLVEHTSLSLNQTFSYHSEQEIPAGVRVKVPFGRQTLVGLVMERHDTPPEGDFKIRSILEILDPAPLLNAELQALSQHLSHITLSSLMSVIKTMLPSSYKPSTKAAKVVMEDWMVPVYPPIQPEQPQLLETPPTQQRKASQPNLPLETAPFAQSEEPQSNPLPTDEPALFPEPNEEPAEQQAEYQTKTDSTDKNNDTYPLKAASTAPFTLSEHHQTQQLMAPDQNSKVQVSLDQGTEFQEPHRNLDEQSPAQASGSASKPEQPMVSASSDHAAAQNQPSALQAEESSAGSGPDQPSLNIPPALSKPAASKPMPDATRFPKSIPLTRRQQEIAEAFIAAMPAAAARKQFSPTILKALLMKGILRLEQRPKRFTLTHMQGQDAWPALTADQQRALDQIRASDNPMILLHGVTGSGKTEVFFHLIQEQLDLGRQVLVLVPEIGLTPMMVSRIQRRFGCEMVIYHSRLSSAEAADQYRKVKAMGSGIVLGTRSAVFLPMDNLGLIIMDEEHDTSYKQDSMPKYHVRDAAEFRARWHGCKLLMASATPCLESYARAVQKVYTLVQMPNRAAGSLPQIQLIDMKTQRSYGGLSYPLIQQIERRLAAKEQVILLLNRRGYIPVARCTSCKNTVECEDCGIPLSYHKSEKALVCHICGRHYPLQKECPHCHKSSWSDLGLGTQKLEECLHDLFPDARVVRMDADSTRSKHGHAQVLNTFEAEGDILLGTQMVAKGLDYERVTLTGIVNADNALARADYRAAEMSYQMLEQASGRAGRGQFPGQVLIQTYNPDHYVLQYILHHDYRGFFVREMKYRHMGLYPPYLYMATLVFHHQDLNKAYQSATRARLFLETKGAHVLGPMEITMRKKVSRIRLLIKDKDHNRLSSLLWEYTEWHKSNLKSIDYEINMDPMILEE